MRYSKVGIGTVAVALMLLSAGCMTASNSGTLATMPVVPEANEQVTLNQLLVLVDVTGSMAGGKFHHEKRLVDAFAGAMPDGSYEAGISSFSGVNKDEWVQCPLAHYDRDRFDRCESRVKLLGSLTPLDRAIRMLAPQMAGKGGNGALLVFSDGKARNKQAVLDACAEMRDAHRGNLCIYTVQIGDSARGKDILDGMVATAGCGQSWLGAEVMSETASNQMVRAIFLGPRAAENTPSAARPAIVLPGEVLFDLDKDILKPEGKLAVDKVVVLLKANPSETVVIEGHTCDLASDAYNMDLSQRRADSVRNYAISQGIDAARMSTKAYGESQPAVPNTSEANRKLNRRVTIVW